MDQTFFFLTFVAAIGCGLIAGTFFVFSVAVMEALRRLPTNSAISAMQSINVVIVNPIFLSIFIGTAVISLILSALSLLNLDAAGSGCLLAGSLFYFVGTFLVTIGRNVPLNNSLAEVDPNAATGYEVWNGYARNWTFWNHIRTVAATISLAMLIASLTYQK
jgi:Predicted integral membrane protein